MPTGLTTHSPPASGPSNRLLTKQEKRKILKLHLQKEPKIEKLHPDLRCAPPAMATRGNLYENNSATSQEFVSKIMGGKDQAHLSRLVLLLNVLILMHLPSRLGDLYPALASCPSAL